MTSNHRLDIRPVTDSDLDAVLAVYRQCEDFLALGTQPTASSDMVRNDLEHSRAEGGCYCGVYDAADTMLGIVDFIPEGFEGNPRHAFLSLLMMASPFRRQGIGGQVVAAVEARIRANPRIEAILSAVQVNNPAGIRFWDRQGYQTISGPEPQADGTTVFRLRKDLRCP